MIAAWEAIAGLLIIYVVPGLGVTRALFPERRVFRPLSLKNLVEQLTTSVVLSVGLTILVSFAWLGTSIGVQSGWSDPIVEETLAGVAVVAFAIAAVRGAFARNPPAPPPREPEGGHSDPMAILRHLDELHREERSVQHRLRLAGTDTARSAPLAQELERIRSEAARIRAEREEEYARS